MTRAAVCIGYATPRYPISMHRNKLRLPRMAHQIAHLSKGQLSTSGYLQAFGDGVTETEADDTDIDHMSRVHPDVLHKHVSFDNQRPSVSRETQGLRQKLENISTSINRIREELQSGHDGKLNKTMMSLHEQLTEIQDQVEDAENDIESTV